MKPPGVWRAEQAGMIADSGISSMRQLQRLGAVLTALSLIPGPVCLGAQSAVPPRVVTYPADAGVSLGQGWSDLLEQKTQSTCITFAVSRDTAQTSMTDLRDVVDQSSFMDRLQISADVQVKAIVFSATASTRFVHKLTLATENHNFAVYSHVENGAQWVAPVSAPPVVSNYGFLRSLRDQLFGPTPAPNQRVDLTPPSVELLRRDPKEFRRQCGDRYVSAITSGAELIGLVAVQHTSRIEDDSLTNRINAGGLGQSLSAEVTSTLQRFADQKRLELRFTQTGGTGDPQAIDLAGIMAKVADLRHLAHVAGRPLRIQLDSYSGLPSWPSPWPVGREPTGRERLATEYGRLVSLYNDITNIDQQPAAFVLGYGTTVADLRQWQDTIQLRLQVLEDVARRCEQQGGAVCADADATTLDDYKIRVHMPVLWGSFPEDVARIAAESALVRAQRRLDDSLTTIVRLTFMALSRVSTFPPDAERRAREALLQSPELQPLVADRDGRQAALKLAQGRWAAGLREAIVSRWIRTPVRVRCEIRQLDPGCLSNAQIDALAARVVVRSL